MASLVGSSFQDQSFRPGWVGGADSGDINPLFEEMHLAGMQRRITEGSIFAGQTQKQTIAGTDTLSWDQSSGAQLTKLARGVIPETSVGSVERVSLEVDTILIIRTPIALIDLHLSNPDKLSSITEEHAIEFLKHHDRAVPLMAIKAAQISAKIANVDSTGVPDGTFELHDGWYRAELAAIKPGWTGFERNCVVGFRGGTSIELPAEGWKDWRVLEQAMTAAMLMIGKKNIDQAGAGGRWYVTWDIYGTLLQNDRFSPMSFKRQNSELLDLGLLDTIHNIAIIPTNRIGDMAQDVGVRNLMSNARNNFAYDTKLADARCCAVWFAPKALKEIELISHQSASFWSDIDKTRYIDDIWSYAIGPDRLEYTAAIFRNAVEFPTAQSIIDAGGSSSYVPGTTTLW